MVLIDLAPEAVSRARTVRRRSCELATVVLALLALHVGVALIEEGVRIFDQERRAQDGKMTGELRALREAVEQRRREVSVARSRAKRAEDLTAAQSRVARHMVTIPTLLPDQVTLSSLQISERRIVLHGVAGERSRIGYMVNAIKSHSETTEVAVDRVHDITVDRYMLPEFSIRIEDLR